MRHPIPALRATLAALSLAALSAVSGCGGDPVDVRGTYAINLTNGPNGCELENWTVGETSTGVPVVITQDGANVTVTVQGAAAVYLDVAIGGHVFEGTVSGRHIDATLTGRAGALGSCAYTSIVDLEADLDGDLLTGRLRYYAQTNGLADCERFNTCENTQQLNGTRPPSSGT
jgi:hypothetical protein